MEREIITLREFATLVKTPIEVKSGYNGKVLCKKYDKKKHHALSDREVVAAWAEIRATKAIGYSNIAQPIVCVFLHGCTEYDQEHSSEVLDNEN